MTFYSGTSGDYFSVFLEDNGRIFKSIPQIFISGWGNLTPYKTGKYDVKYILFDSKCDTQSIGILGLNLTPKELIMFLLKLRVCLHTCKQAFSGFHVSIQTPDIDT